MARARPSFLGREFTAGGRVGLAITIVVGLVFVYLGGSVDDRPAPIPSAPLWLGALLAMELAALLVAWGALVLYFGAPRRPLVFGLLAGAAGGVLFVILLLLDESDYWETTADDHRREDPAVRSDPDAS
jgi:hypothetical protein